MLDQDSKLRPLDRRSDALQLRHHATLCHTCSVVCVCLLEMSGRPVEMAELTDLCDVVVVFFVANFHCPFKNGTTVAYCWDRLTGTSQLYNRL